MRVLESVLYAEDLEKAHEFYTGILGLEVISYDPTRNMFLRCEGSVLIVFKPSKTKVPGAGVPPHGTDGIGHLAFRATREEIEIWRERLTTHGVEVIQEVTWKNGAHSIYFRDPALNVLEFATADLWNV